MKKDFVSITDFSREELINLIKEAQNIKKHQQKYNKKLYEKTLLTFFQAPSLRTEVSFDVAMFQMGGEIIDYHAETSPWAKGKESLEDVARVISRYCDCVMLRMPNHEDLIRFAKNATVPIINGLTTLEHPCQIVADFMTIIEKKKELTNLRMAYVGDANNNVTHSLMLGCALLGINLNIGCPNHKEFMPQYSIVKQAKSLSKKTETEISIFHNPHEAVKETQVIYTDSWMSYHIHPSQKKKRIKILKAFQINKKLMDCADKEVIFMHCLPAKRGEEVTSSVIDGKQSVVFDQAENRLYTEKAILLKLIKNR